MEEHNFSEKILKIVRRVRLKIALFTSGKQFLA